MKKPALQRRVSAENVPEGFRETVVGCAECHAILPDSHKDTFDHNGHRVHPVVTPGDCSTCHPEEASQYSGDLMSHAYANLNDTPVFHDLAERVNGPLSFTEGAIGITPSSESTKAATCSECHKGPDVPAYAVYLVSKHGNIYSSLGDTWNFTDVPWEIGADFTAPTCAARHVSLLVSKAGEVVAERSHRMNDRHAWRIFGLVYAHPHPVSPDTTGIRNKAGLPLPTEHNGEPAASHLIDAGEQKARTARMRKVCSGCHGGSWVEWHFPVSRRRSGRRTI